MYSRFIQEYCEKYKENKFIIMIEDRLLWMYEQVFKDIQNKFPNFTYHVALSDPMPQDNWNGYTGFIHQVVHDNYLSTHEDPTEIEYYMCGPPVMNTAAKGMLHDLGVEEEMIDFDDFG